MLIAGPDYYGPLYTAEFDENQRAAGTLNPLRDNNERKHQRGEKERHRWPRLVQNAATNREKKNKKLPPVEQKSRSNFSLFQSIYVAILHSCSRVFVTVVKVCALVNGGQDLFFSTRAWWRCFFFFLNRSRSGVKTYSDFVRGVPIFFWRRQNQKLAFARNKIIVAKTPAESTMITAWPWFATVTAAKNYPALIRSRGWSSWGINSISMYAQAGLTQMSMYTQAEPPTRSTGPPQYKPKPQTKS